MGNKIQAELASIGTEVVPEFKYTTHNSAIQNNPKPLFEVNERMPMTQRGSIIFSWILTLPGPSYRVLLAHSRGVHTFDLLQGTSLAAKYEELEEQGITWAALTEDSETLVLGHSYGVLRFLSADTLAVVSSVQYDFAISSIALHQDKIFVGLANGSVYGRHRYKDVDVLSQTDISNGKVSYLAYATGKSKLIALGGSKIFAINIQDSAVTQVGDFAGDCLGLQILDTYNLVTCINGCNDVYIFDLETNMRLMAFQVPQVLSGPVKASSLLVVGNLFLIGLSEGSVLVASMTLDSEQMKYTWKPIRVVVSRSVDRSVAAEGIMAVSHMSIDRSTDILLIGNAISKTWVVNDFTQGLVSQNQENLPWFSLGNYRPRKQSHERNPNAPMFSLGTTATTVDNIQPEIPQESSGDKEIEEGDVKVSEEAIERVRNRVEGRRKGSEPIDVQDAAPPKDPLPVARDEPASPEPTPLETLDEDIQPSEEPVSIVPDLPAEAKPRKTISGFQRFLYEKKAEILAESPELTQKDLVMQISAQWGVLGIEEKTIYDQEIEIE